MNGRQRLVVAALACSIALATSKPLAAPYSYASRGDFFTDAVAPIAEAAVFAFARRQVAWIEVVGTGTFQVQCQRRLVQGGTWATIGTINASTLFRVPPAAESDYGAGFLQCWLQSCTGCTVSARWWVMPSP